MINSSQLWQSGKTKQKMCIRNTHAESTIEQRMPHWRSRNLRLHSEYASYVNFCWYFLCKLFSELNTFLRQPTGRHKWNRGRFLPSGGTQNTNCNWKYFFNNTRGGILLWSVRLKQTFYWECTSSVGTSASFSFWIEYRFKWNHFCDRLHACALIVI